MSAKEGKGAILAAFAANIGIAISKLVAFSLTGASSLLAESVHSLVDSSNQILLLIGGRQSRRKPTRVHPFGYARAHFLYAFIVSVVLFSLGGLFSIYEGIHKITNPVPINFPIIAYVVLALAMLFEGLALRTALNEARTFKPARQNWWQFLRQTKSINHVVLALEDSAAITGLTFATLGLTLALLTGNPAWDGVGTLFIGVLLIGVAFFLFREVKSLLIGEAVDDATGKKMREIILTVDGIDQVVDLKTLYVGPRELFIAMKVIVSGKDSADVVAQMIDEVEARLRKEFPIARLIYIEPDTYKTPKQQVASDRSVAREINH